MSISRRGWLSGVSVAAIGSLLSPESSGEDAEPRLQIATFRCDITPPMGHPLCGGWIKPVLGVDDPLEVIGLVLVGSGEPIVLCAVDWTGILNTGHRLWREAIAEAVETNPRRVAVQCVHQHNAPFACLDSQALVGPHSDLPPIIDEAFFHQSMESVAAAAAASLKSLQPLTHVAASEAPVVKVAGNRRIMLGPDGKVTSMRGSSSKDPAHHAAPEGLIDPLLKTVAFYNGDRQVAACHYYACHPMSYYGDGRVSADFCGLARRRREQETGVTHLYFDGCGGNIGAGKYNDGSPEMRPVLSQRIYEALVASEEQLRPRMIEAIRWADADVQLQPDAKWNAEELASRIANKEASVVDRSRSAYTLAYLQRYERQEPIVLSSLSMNDITMLNLPSECFVEYQLRAQKAALDRFVACAAYGDGGPWYLPTREAFPQGGYEVSVAWCGPDVEDSLWKGIDAVLS